MNIEVREPKHRNQRAVLFVNGEAIKWSDLKTLVVLSIWVEEYNNGDFPLRKHLSVLTELPPKQFKKLTDAFERRVSFKAIPEGHGKGFNDALQRV